MSVPPRPIDDLLGHHEWLRRLAAALLRGSDGDDAAQDTWLAALRTPPAAPPAARAWLRRVLLRRAGHRRRDEATRGAYEQAAPPRPSAPDPAELVERAEMHQHVARLVLALDEPYRTAVLLRFFEGLAPGEIAAATGVPVETVRTRLRRALAKLRERLDRDDAGRDWRALFVPWLSVSPPPLHAAAGGLLMGIGTRVAAAALVLALGWLAWDRAVAPSGPPTESATAPGEPVPVGQRTSPPRSVEDSDVEPTPADAVTVLVHVRSESGAAIGGAIVEAVAVPVERWSGHVVRAVATMGDPARIGAAAVTDARGDAALALPAGTSWTLRARAPGRRPAGAAGVRFDRSMAPSRVVLTLLPGCALRGTVRDGAGRPAPAVRVLGFAGTPGLDQQAWPIRAETVSDATGTYELDGLAPGDVELHLAPQRGPLRTAASVRVPDIERLDLVVETGGCVEGTVTDADDGSVVSGATIVLSGETADGATVTTRATTDGAGRYAADGLPPCVLARWRTEILRDGWVVEPTAPGAAEDVAVVSGAIARLDVRVRRGARVEGVVDAEALPVAGASVRLHFGAAEWAVWRTTRTDASGAFAFDGVPEQRVRVEAWTDEPRQRGDASADVPRAGTVRVDVGLAPRPSRDVTPQPGPAAADGSRTSVVVRVIDDRSGAPVGAAVVLTGPADDRRLPRLADFVAVARTDDTGAATVTTALPSQFIVRHGAFASAAVTVAEPAPAEIVVRLRPRRTVGGTARFADGRPAANARIALQRPGALETTVVAGPDGRFLFEDVAAGSVRLVLRTAGAPRIDAAALDDVPAGTADIALVAPVERVVVGRVIGPDGRAVPHLPLRIADPATGWEEHGCASGLDGGFRFDPAPPGAWTVRVAANPATWVLSQDVQISPDAVEATVVVVPGRSVSGRLADDGGEGVAGIELEVRRPGTPDEADAWGRRALVRTRADGSFDAGPFAGGDVEIRLSEDSVDPFAAPRVVVGGVVPVGATGVRLVLSRGGVIAGSVRTAGDPGLRGALIRAVAEGRPERLAIVRDDGRFELSGLEPGSRYVLRAEADGFADVVTSPLAPGSGEVVPLLLGDGATLAGRLLDAAGRPAAGRALLLTALEGTSRARATTGSDGRFVVRGLPAGEFALEVAVPVPGMEGVAFRYLRAAVLRSGDRDADVTIPRQ